MVEQRIQTSVQSEMEKFWKDHMEKDDKIKTNKVKTLNRGPTIK